MDYQFAEAISDLELGDIVKINNKVGKLDNIRMIQEVKNSRVYFEYKLKNSDWVKRNNVGVVRKID